MTMITTDQLRDLSVKVVEDFINTKVSLVDGIAKCASEMELNAEQTKRLVETTNTIAYLKLQKEASDKTFEFPVADYTHVMKAMCIPEKPDGTLAQTEFEGQVKVAGELTYAADEFNPDMQTVQAWMMKEMLSNRATLQKLAVDKAEVLMNIGNLQTFLMKDEYGIEKLAEVCEEDLFKKLAILIKKADAPIRNHVFKTVELEPARKLVALFKRAEDLILETQQRQEIEKKAMVLAMTGAMGKSIGGAFSGAAAAGVKSISTAGKRLGKSKVLHPLDIAGAALTEPSPSKSVWDNLQGSQKRF